MPSLTSAAIVTAVRDETRRLGHPPSEDEWVRGTCRPTALAIRQCFGVRNWAAVLQLLLPTTDHQPDSRRTDAPHPHHLRR